jgi:hypothetical protein
LNLQFKALHVTQSNEITFRAAFPNVSGAEKEKNSRQLNQPPNADRDEQSKSPYENGLIACPELGSV